MRVLHCYPALFVFLLVGPFAKAQEKKAMIVVHGILLSAHDNQPMERVSVMVDGSNYGTMSDANGKFRLSARAGGVLRITHLSYQTLMVDLPVDVMGEHALVLLMKVDSAHQLDPVTVSRRDKQAFSRDFMNMQMVDSLGSIARNNLSKEKRAILLLSTPTNGKEAYSLAGRRRHERAAASNRVPYFKFLDLVTWLDLLLEKRKKKRSR